MVQVNILRAAMNLSSFRICCLRQRNDPRAAARPPCRHPPQGDLMDGKCVHISYFSQEICRDIRKLDHAKANLTATITAFRRLSMLVAAVGGSPLGLVQCQACG